MSDFANQPRRVGRVQPRPVVVVTDTDRRLVELNNRTRRLEYISQPLAFPGSQTMPDRYLTPTGRGAQIVSTARFVP